MTARQQLEDVFAHQDREALVDVACDLVNIPSPTGAEGAIGDYLAGRLSELGLKVRLEEVEEGRNNLLARMQGDDGGPTVMYLGHLDTSTTPDEDLPFGFQARATVKDGWIYGLGISNMKCAFAGYFSALQMMRDAGTQLPGEILVAAVVGEIEKAPVDEWQGKLFRGGGSGARYMLNHGITADFCINGEPTGLRLQVGNAGYIYARIHVVGSPQATFSRQAAIDPIPKAMGLIERLREWEQEYQQRHPHPFMKPLANTGAIYGGYPYKPGITAPFCNLYLHITTLPGQSILGVKAELETMLQEARKEDGELEASVDFYLVSNGHELDAQHPGARAVEFAHQAVFGSDVVRPTPERYSISSDNSPLAEFGIPGITYGAGGVNRAGEYTAYEPGIGEVVGIDNLAACARVYAASTMKIMEDWSTEDWSQRPKVY